MILMLTYFDNIGHYDVILIEAVQNSQRLQADTTIIISKSNIKYLYQNTHSDILPCLFYHSVLI